MKLRFFLIEMLITFVGILIIVVASTNIYYQNSLSNCEDTLSVYVNQYDMNTYSFDSDGAIALSEKLDSARVTYITLEGVVVGDSEVSDLSSFDNHLDRAEVVDAIESGVGIDVRESTSIGKVLIYYCAQVDTASGTALLRIAIPTSSALNIFSKAIPTIIIFLAFDTLACAIIAFLLVDHVLKPVELIAHDASIGKEVKSKYSELAPLCDILNSRNIEIKDKINTIKENKKIASIVLDNMEHGIIILGPNKKIALINNMAKDLLDVYDTLDEVFFFKQDDEISEIISEKNNTLVYRTFDEEVYAFRFSFMEGKSICLITNVTEIINAQKSKNDFIANVTHEMNTPLTSIKGFAELVSSGVMDKEKVVHASEVILEQSNRLTQLIKSIINYSSYESNDLPSYDVNLSNIIQSSISSLEPAASERGIVITSDIVENAIIKSRTERVQEVITNLIVNAIKYNKEKGMINITLHNEGVLRILEVKDTGIGIAEENKDKIFDRFFTVDKSHNKATSGFGLGLAVVKKICAQANWKIEVESTLGEGSLFRIIFK
ncbi:MAG: HAMP domain-containing histidine kinase [Acholeplasmatales bacterium]|nr:HAMP domain-containing histidine kinase [Acholeplasmatales bacterium]